MKIRRFLEDHKAKDIYVDIILLISKTVKLFSRDEEFL